MTETSEKSRIDIIKNLQNKRNSRIISYIVNTREGLDFRISSDAVQVIYGHLENLDIKKDEKIDLFLHSLGGDGLVPWKLVNLFREFSEHLEVLVPYKAYSAATLIALGADKIIMHRMGELGPVDPKVANEFNPTTPKGFPVGINVEDVASYISFVKEFVGITHEDELIQALNALTNNIHPLAIGNVHRFYTQSRMMAKKLLKLHMKDPKDEHDIEEISETLTSKLFFHGHPINRKEAIDLKLKIEEPDQDVENLMWQLYESYEKEMELSKPFNPQEILNESKEDNLEVDVIGSCIGSEAGEDRFVSKYKIMRPPIPHGAPIDVQMQASIAAIFIPLSGEWRHMQELKKRSKIFSQNA